MFLYDKCITYYTPSPSYVGRQQPYHIVNCLVTPPIICEYGAMPWVERGTVILASWLKCYWEALTAVARKGATLCRVRQAACARIRLARPRGAVRTFLGANPVWDTALRLVLEMEEEPASLGIEVGKLLASARRRAAAEAKARRLTRCASYWGWCEDQLRSGAGGLHALARQRPDDTVVAIVVCGVGGVPVGPSVLPQDILANELASWEQAWGRHPSVGAPWRGSAGSPLGPVLPPLSPRILRDAAKGFPHRKGFAGFCARWFLYLTDPVLEAVCRLLEACERLGMWPGAIKVALMHLIPKREKGKRPIGLVDGLCRLWERARRDLVREWRAQNRRSYDFGARGRQSTDAVWTQALYDEAMEQSGMAASTVLYDLVKAFESVPLEHVWGRGLVMGFPPGVLRLALEVCSFARHLTLSGVVAKGVDTLSAILAGTTFATDLLYAVMVGPCDRLGEMLPSLNLSLVVDDLAVQAIGSEGQVVRDTRRANHIVVDELTDIGCLVSRGTTWAPGGGNTVAVSTSRGVRDEIRCVCLFCVYGG